MTKGRVKGVLSAQIYVTLLEDVTRAKTALGEVFRDADIDNDDNYIFFENVEQSTFYYAPPVYYTSNGDGSPEEYEDELLYCDETEARCDIEEALKGIDCDIESVTYERVYNDDEEYYR